MDALVASLLDPPELQQALLRTIIKETATSLKFSRRSRISVTREVEKSQIVCQDVIAGVIATMKCFNTFLFEATAVVGRARLIAGLCFQKGIEYAAPLHSAAVGALVPAGKTFAKNWRLHPALFVYTIQSTFSLPSAKPFSLPHEDVIAGVLETAESNSGSELSVLAA